MENHSFRTLVKTLFLISFPSTTRFLPGGRCFLSVLGLYSATLQPKILPHSILPPDLDQTSRNCQAGRIENDAFAARKKLEVGYWSYGCGEYLPISIPKKPNAPIKKRMPGNDKQSFMVGQAEAENHQERWLRRTSNVQEASRVGEVPAVADTDETKIAVKEIDL